MIGVVGEFNKNLKELEKITKTSLYSRGNSILIKSNRKNNEIVKNAIQAIDINNNEASITISSRVGYSRPINGKVFSTICQIDISDTGPGIPDEIQEQVFFPMMSTKDDGSGLGLSIAQDIIRIHGGSIAFSSKPGNTVFSILLPLPIVQLKGVANA